jgi:protein-tyrosine phosphatase
VDAIQQDYMLSESKLKPEREEKLQEIRSIGLPDSFADCEPGWAGKVKNWIDGRYGGVEEYLEKCGVTQKQREAVRQIMMAS